MYYSHFNQTKSSIASNSGIIGNQEGIEPSHDWIWFCHCRLSCKYRGTLLERIFIVKIGRRTDGSSSSPFEGQRFALQRAKYLAIDLQRANYFRLTFKG